MDFEGIKCPVCNTEFKDGDDIVVCPECGTPHHRECYEKENRCFYDSRHGEGFSFEKEPVSDNSAQQSDNPDIIICARCKSENPKGMFYCGKLLYQPCRRIFGNGKSSSGIPAAG